MPGNELPIWAAFSVLIPLLLGGVATAMRLFVEPLKEFRHRADLIEKRLLESIAVKLAALLNHARRIDDDSLLRGDAKIEPDLVGEYTDAFFRLFRWTHRLQLLRLKVRWCFHALLGIAFLGVVGVLVGLLWPPSRQYIAYSAGALVLLQSVLILVNYSLASQLEQYEEIS